MGENTIIKDIVESLKEDFLGEQAKEEEGSLSEIEILGEEILEEELQSETSSDEIENKVTIEETTGDNLSKSKKS